MWEPGRRARLVVGVALVVVAVIAVGWPLPYYSEGPGPARDVLSRIIYEGEPRYEPTGQLELTTVRYQQLTGLTALRAWLDDTLAIVPAATVYPPDVPIDVTKQRGISQMDQSKIDATAAALRALHEYPKHHGEGALIESTVTGCPADGKLFPGDIITAIDGTDVRDAAQASQLFDRIPVTRRCASISTSMARSSTPPSRGRRAGRRTSRSSASRCSTRSRSTSRFESDDIGGPSAGLMWALGIYELLTPGDLTAGRTIAGTGEIGPDGTVYPIGGIRDKVIAAERAGATLFLAPADNMAELAGVDTGDMQVVSVATFDDARKALEPSGSTSGG